MTRTYKIENIPATTHKVVDLCPTCFKDKLLPWLREQGAEIKVKEYDW